jgi:hypothetical protein
MASAPAATAARNEFLSPAGARIKGGIDMGGSFCTVSLRLIAAGLGWSGIRIDKKGPAYYKKTAFCWPDRRLILKKKALKIRILSNSFNYRHFQVMASPVLRSAFLKPRHEKCMFIERFQICRLTNKNGNTVRSRIIRL